MRPVGTALTAVLIACGPEPKKLVVTAIEPASATAGVETAVVIRGEFHRKTTVSFRDQESSYDDQFLAALDGTELLRVTWDNHDVLNAVVPSDLPDGEHDLTVIDPHGNRAEISAAFRAEPCSPSLDLLVVMHDQDDSDGELDLSADDLAVVSLFEGAGHTVTFFAPATGGCNPANDHQAAFDAAVAAGTWDAIYLSQSCQTDTLVDGDTADPTAPFYLNGAAVGILFNDDALIDNAFFADNHGSDVARSIVVTDTSTFVTSFLTLGPVTLLDGVDAPIGWTNRAGVVAPGVTALAEAPSGSDHLSLLLVASGGALLHGATAPARRANIPAFAAERWTLPARQLALRALLWVAGADGC